MPLVLARYWRERYGIIARFYETTEEPTRERLFPPYGAPPELVVARCAGKVRTFRWERA